MRDPARIDPLLDLIRRIMHANPDLRLGQIIAIVSEQPFYLEDDVLMARLWGRFEPAEPAPKRRNCWTCRNNMERNTCRLIRNPAMPEVWRWIFDNLDGSDDMPATDADNCPGYEETP